MTLSESADLVLDKGLIQSRVLDTATHTGLLRVLRRNGKDHADEFVLEGLSHSLWSVLLRSSRGSRLAEGDVIKLGRVHMRVKQLSAHGETRPLFPELVSATPILLQEPSMELGSQRCRICLSEHQTSVNPLVAPCKCIGKLRYTHVSCLEEWIKSRLVQKVRGSAVAYLLRRIDCEMCKGNLPTTISYNDEVRDLINIAIPDDPFIVLEDLRSVNCMARGLHVISLKEGGYFRLGRSQDCEIYLSDASISRFHANISLHKEGFYIEDRGSKFGTMLKVTDRLTLLPNISATVQVNSVLVTVTAQHQSRLRSLFCCFRGGNEHTSEETNPHNRGASKHALPKRLDLETRNNAIFRASQEVLMEPGTTFRKVDEEGDILVGEDAE